MANLNKVMLIGNLTRDPETRFLPSGSPVCEFGMAINRVWNDQSGEKREQTTFVDCSAFGRTGETISKYMSKGRPIFVEGRLNFRSWETQEGQKRSKLDVIVESFQFLGGGQGQGGGQGGQDRRGAPQQQQARSGGNGGWGQPSAPPPVSMEASMDEDDIPF